MKKKKAIVVILSLIVLIVLSAGACLLIHSRYNGVYAVEGYGLCILMQNGSVKVYEVTDDYYSAEPGFDGLLLIDMLYSGLGKMKLVQTDEGLQMIDVGAQVTYRLLRKDALFLKDRTEVKEGMPVEAFAMFYQMYDENYAFESLYGADLTAKYEELKSRVNLKTTDAELFERMKELVTDLKDGHVELTFGDEVFCAAEYRPEWITDNEQLSLLSGVIIGRYAKNYTKFDDCLIRYGMLSEDVGLIIIHNMGTESLDKTKSTRAAMDQIVREFNDAGISSVVIELRFNGGGFDEASLLLAGYFTESPYLAYRKQVYCNGVFSEPQDIYVKPGKLFFDGDVYVLTSGYTISAAETFIRAMLANPNGRVTVVGEKTAGFYSDALERSLPGGYTYSLSNERYLSHTGEILEGKGIEPDVRIPVCVDAARAGRDDALDYILKSTGSIAIIRREE
ncbi:MAG: S41 family peptidase [Clostridiaceae bacterium]|nr:S41 family peptidase [Clostridiaceae bacterium]